MKKILLATLSIMAANSLSFSQPVKKISVVNDAVDPKIQTFKNDLFWKIVPWKGSVSDLFPLDKKNLLVEFRMEGKAGYFIYEHSEKEFERPEITDWRNFYLIEQFTENKNKFIFLA